MLSKRRVYIFLQIPGEMHPYFEKLTEYWTQNMFNLQLEIKMISFSALHFIFDN